MIMKGIKALIKKIRITAISINIGFIKLSLTRVSSKVNMYKRMEFEAPFFYFINQ